MPFYFVKDFVNTDFDMPFSTLGFIPSKYKRLKSRIGWRKLKRRAHPHPFKNFQ